MKSRPYKNSLGGILFDMYLGHVTCCYFSYPSFSVLQIQLKIFPNSLWKWFARGTLFRFPRLLHPRDYINGTKSVKIVLQSFKSFPAFKSVERNQNEWMSISWTFKANMSCHFARLIGTLQFQKCCLPAPVLSNSLSKFIYKISSSKKRLPMFKMPYLNAPSSFDCRLFKNTQEITMITIVNCEEKKSIGLLT